MRGGAPSWNGRFHVGQQGPLTNDRSLDASRKLRRASRNREAIECEPSHLRREGCKRWQSSDRMAAGPEGPEGADTWIRSAWLKGNLGETAGLKRAATVCPHIHSHQKAMRVARMFYVEGRLAGWRTRPDATHVPVENPCAQKSGRPQTLFFFLQKPRHHLCFGMVTTRSVHPGQNLFPTKTRKEDQPAKALSCFIPPKSPLAIGAWRMVSASLGRTMIPSKSDPQTHGIQKNVLKLAHARQASKRTVSLESFQEMLYAWGVGFKMHLGRQRDIPPKLIGFVGSLSACRGASIMMVLSHFAEDRL